MSLIAFHEKAGRCQVLFFFFFPKAPCFPRLVERGSERPGAVKGAFCAALANP